MLCAKRENRLLELCAGLIRIQSCSGQEAKIVSHIEIFFRNQKFDGIYKDDFGSIVGYIKGRRPGKKLLFDAHVDTVPVHDPAQWIRDPFGGQVVNGRLYGRGASDMKGALGAMMAAAQFFSEDQGRDFAGEIHIAGVVMEEMFEGVSCRNISRQVSPDWVVIGEASELNLKCGQRGRAEIVIETFGKAAHSANPEKGVNAIHQMMQLMAELDRLETCRHPILGKGIRVVTDIKSSPYPGVSVVPEYCRVTCDRRLLPGETRTGVLQPIHSIIEDLQRKDPMFRARAGIAVGQETCYTGMPIQAERFFPAWLINETDDFVQQVYHLLKAVDLDPAITHYNFCTNGSHYAGEAGIPTIGFGPSRENLAHVADEYVEVEDLKQACRGYYGIMGAMK
jgi:putative selenium metabolism hydrolase